MNKVLKIISNILIDVVLSIFALFLTFVISPDIELHFNNISNGITFSFLIFPFVTVVFNYIFKLYNLLWRYAHMTDFIKLAFSVFASAFTLYLVQLSIGFYINYTDIAMLILVSGIFSFIFRLTIRVSVLKKNTKSANEVVNGNIMIIGAGAAGALLIKDILSNPHTNSIKCIIDDDLLKKDKYINGIKIVGGMEEIIPAVEKYKIDTIVFAIPTCPTDRKATILNICQKTNCKIRIIPSLYNILSKDDIRVSQLRNVEIEDLLGREPIDIKVESVMNYVSDKCVLVTGGGGSIGSELCRQIAAHNPKMLIIFDIYENNAYDIQNELLREHPDINLKTLIGSVRDINRLESLFKSYKPQIVFHAAAHKHVPLMEDSPNESIKNNVFGTLNTAKCADKYNVQKFILISTDKAVNPTNIMGASKRICEMVVQHYNTISKTEFAAVRFGNVLGSNGSVIPLFKKQIENGGPITVTDPKIIRYFMTIPEAVSLVLQAGASAKGGEIFVLDMGEPVKILDLAENVIKLSGLRPYIDIKIEFIGLRPGEKLYEEKLLAEEGLMRTDNSLIHIGQPINFNHEIFVNTLNELQNNMADDNFDIRALVKTIVPTYSYSVE